MHQEMKALFCSGALVLLGVGCGAAVKPAEITIARRELTLAQNGEAGRRTPAELLVAGRTLRDAERAYEDDPSTTEARDLAYVSHRQTLIAEAHARSAAIDESTAGEQANYQRELENSNRVARVVQANDRATIAAAGQQVQQQSATIAQQQGQLANSEAGRVEAEAGRVEAEARATEAMRRLSVLVTVREGPTQTIITILGSVLFRSGGAELLPGAASSLAATADALNAQPTRSITIEGFTDSTGTVNGNEVLSQARAESVRAFLVSRGVDQARVRAVGIGQARPVADNATAEGRANNRRVEIVLGPNPPAAPLAQVSVR
jgi:outer membrane protein OmpA-like peptidoglycan-associated protein